MPSLGSVGPITVSSATRRSHSGEFVVVGCLFAPAIVLLLAGVLLPSRGIHGNMLVFLLAILAFLAASAVMFLQIVLPKPPEPADSPRDTTLPPEG